MIRFYLLTFDGVLTAEAPPKELASGKSPFSDLFYAAHDVLFLTRLVSQDPDWDVVQAGCPGSAPGESAPAGSQRASRAGQVPTRSKRLPAGRAPPTRRHSGGARRSVQE